MGLKISLIIKTIVTGINIAILGTIKYKKAVIAKIKGRVTALNE